MPDRFVIRNVSGTILSLQIESHRFRMKPNETIDLCLATGMSVKDIESQSQIIRNVGYNNIRVETSETADGNKELDVYEKILALVDTIIENTSKSKPVSKEDLEEMISKIPKVSTREGHNDNQESDVVSEEKLKQELLIKQAESFVPEKNNTGNFGKSNVSIDADDFSGLL